MDRAWQDVARLAAFDYVWRLSEDETVPVRFRLLSSFAFDGHRIPLIGQSGIFKPKLLDHPISIRTAAPQPGRKPPYDDERTADGYLRYRYRGTDPMTWDNVALRRAMEEGLSLLYFAGVATGIYSPSAAIIVEDDPTALTFTVALLPISSVVEGSLRVELNEAQRRYYLRVAKQRANQAHFRAEVLSAYRERCSICELRHPELLDAAHIVPDSKGGRPIVQNGLALCKIHHAAFDHLMVGVRPDYVVEVREDLLAESDGPMLRHGIQGVHGQSLLLPRRANLRPDPMALERRYEEFLRAS